MNRNKINCGRLFSFFFNKVKSVHFICIITLSFRVSTVLCPMLFDIISWLPVTCINACSSYTYGFFNVIF